MPSAALGCAAISGRPDSEVGGQLVAQRFRQIGDFSDFAHPAVEQPAANLRGTKRWLAALGEPGD